MSREAALSCWRVTVSMPGEAEALTSRLTPETLALAAGFAAVILGFTRWFWRFGLRRYSGASA